MIFAFSPRRIVLVGLTLLALDACAPNPPPATAAHPPARNNLAQATPPVQQGANGAAPVINGAPAAPPSALSAASPAKPAGPAKVAILVPLSGPNATLGQAMLNAAQLAEFDVAAPKFELMPRDTGATEDSAAAAARDAVASGAQLLIGPVFGANVPAVRAVALAAHVPMITLSSDSSLAAPDCYVLGFAPEAQADRIVNFAMHRNDRHFAALVPDTPYGALVGQAFQSAVANYGGTLLALDKYDPARHDSEGFVRDLAQQKAGIDAIFLPAGGADLHQLAGQLAAAGFDPHVTRLLGTGIWDVPNIVKQTPFMISGWYAAPDPAMRTAFISSYTNVYGSEPPRIATIAYDATALAAVLAKRNARYDQAALTNPNGFVGLDGIFRLLPDGNVQRGLAVLELTEDGAHVVDFGPTTFAGTDQ